MTTAADQNKPRIFQGTTIRTLSVSKMKRFETCNRSFRLHYIDKLKAEENDVLKFGSLLHAVLERVMKWAVEHEFTGTIPMSMVEDFYREEFAESGITGMALFHEGRMILEEHFRRNPTVNWLDIIGVEYEFRVVIGGFEFIGLIDRMDRDGEQVITIRDYKSNRLLFSEEDLEYDIQLSVYEIVIREHFPWAKNVKLAFDLLRHGMTQSTSRTPEQLESAKQYIVSVGQSLDAKVTADEALLAELRIARQAHADAQSPDDMKACGERIVEIERKRDELFPAKLNANCQYCDHRLACSTYRAAVIGGLEVVKADKYNLEEVAAERLIVDKIAKAAYERKKRLDGYIKAVLDTVPELILAGHRFRMITWQDREYSPLAVMKTLIEFGVSMEDIASVMKVSSKGLDALVTRLGNEWRETRKGGGGHAALLELELDARADYSPAGRIDARQIKDGLEAKPASTVIDAADVKKLLSGKTEETTATADGEATVATTSPASVTVQDKPKRGRGRPPKKKPETTAPPQEDPK